MVRGDVFATSRETAKARADYAKAVELDPGSAAAWLRLGRHDLVEANDPPRAIESLDKAIALDARLGPAYVLRARAKLAAGTEAERASALEDLAEALRLEPDTAEAYFVRAGVARAVEDYAGAVADLRRALALDPRNAAFRALWDEIYTKDGARLIDEAETLLNAGQYDEAAACVQKALEIDPRSGAFHEALRIIEAERKKRGH
jgi:tetratricopeptide (TPR) repeat protein